MLTAMAGLPGTGKSTLAARLAEELAGVVLCKDAVRAALFPPRVLDYSVEQDDVCMEAVYAAARHLLRADPSLAVFIDGRTFYRAGHVLRLARAAEESGQDLKIIECVCDDETARRRLEHDLAGGRHPAGNRTFELYLSRKDAAQPITLPRLTLDTGSLSVAECAARCLGYLAD